MKLAILALLGVVASQELMNDESNDLMEDDEIFNENTELIEQPEEDEENELAEEEEGETELAEEDNAEEEENDDALFEDEDDLDEDLNVTWKNKDIATIKKAKRAIKKELHRYGLKNPHLKNQKMLKLKLKAIGDQLDGDISAWTHTKQAKVLKAKLHQMQKSKQGKALKLQLKKLKHDIVVAGKSTHKIKVPFGKGFHIDNAPLGQLKVDSRAVEVAENNLKHSKAAHNVKQIAKKAFNNKRAAIVARNLKNNIAHAFKMSAAQEKKLEAQKKKIAIMIKKLDAYVKKTAKVTQIPKSWKK